LFFGPSVHPVDEVPAGNIVGIVGIADLVLKTGTLSSSWLSPALKSMTFQAKPIVRVAVEPKNYYDLAALEKGLNLLYQYDPAVEIGVDAATGQHTMACLGEIHQEQCVKYLADKFARCEIVVSEPIVPFRETIVASSSGGPQKPLLPQPWNELVDNQRCVAPGVYSVDNAHFSLGFSARPLPIEFLALFENNIALKQKVFGAISTKYLDDSSSFETSSEWRQSALLLLQSLSELPAAVDESTAAERMYNRIVSIGPDDLDSAVNVLTLSAGFTMGLWTHRSRPEDSFESRSPDMLLSIDDPHHRLVVDQLLSRIHSALIAGFQLCVSAGPLMAEPLHGVCFVLEHIHVARDATGLSSAEWEDLLGAMKQHMVYSAEQLNFQLHTGQLISEVRCVATTTTNTTTWGLLYLIVTTVLGT
jgi:ribosome assembly protein 1